MALFRKRQRWDFVWEFPDGTLFELKADDPKMVAFENRKGRLRSRLKKGEISSGEYIDNFKELCTKLGTPLGSIPEGYSISREYSMARVYSRRVPSGKS